MASKSCDTMDYKFLVKMQHIDYEDALWSGVTVRKGYIVAYRRLIISADSKPRKESTPIYIADETRMTGRSQLIWALFFRIELYGPAYKVPHLQPRFLHQVDIPNVMIIREDDEED